MAEDAAMEDECEEYEEDHQAVNNKVEQWIGGMPTITPGKIADGANHQLSCNNVLPSQPPVGQHYLQSLRTVHQNQVPIFPVHVPCQPAVLFNEPAPQHRQRDPVQHTQHPWRTDFTGLNREGFNSAQRSTITRPGVVEEDGMNLSRSQVAARQAVSRDLPFFSGAPEEWPLFYSSFISTTNMCGYTAEENLVRLQKCLKGKAY